MGLLLLRFLPAVKMAIPALTDNRRPRMGAMSPAGGVWRGLYPCGGAHLP